ncbi:polysaccharide deacetylase family protein [Halobacillus litoralis]|uniref:Polysaccharide deacetylase n=1 Tax=Halobacillus litoralis TaxID=45668 RepID=A0A410M8V6_9BACI|nr:polysaccharide deacetylase family protein [Halobacillus litoralis]QAS51151.1 polysaccharide deacetylase [Halobacillus litoralis]
MKKWIGLFLVLTLLLAACSGVESKESQEEEEQEPVTEEKAQEEVAEEEAEDTEENTDSESAEESEETVVEKEPQYEITGNWSFQPIADANPKVALLTFDDAPDQYAVEMAKTLKELDAPAIFFVNGHFIDTEEEKAALKEIHELGFPIGNHTATHASLPDLTEEQQKEEIVGLNDEIEEIIGERPDFFRAPFGQNTEFSKNLAAEEDMLVMNWTYGYDWEAEYQNAEALADIMVNTPLLGNGANLLMHDREWTYEAVDEIVEGIRGKGFELLDPALIQTP